MQNNIMETKIQIFIEIQKADELNWIVVTENLAKQIRAVYLKLQILPPEQNVILIKNRLFSKPKEDNTLEMLKWVRSPSSWRR